MTSQIQSFQFKRFLFLECCRRIDDDKTGTSSDETQSWSWLQKSSRIGTYKSKISTGNFKLPIYLEKKLFEIKNDNT